MAEAVDFVECRCAECGARYRVAPRASARQAECRQCGGVVAVPATDRSTATPSAPSKQRRKPPLSDPPAKHAVDPRTFRTLLEGFSGDFTRPRVTIGHRLMALAVVSVMIMLPVIYVCFIALIAWLTVWHAMHDHVWMTVPGIRLKIAALVAYIGLIVLGALWVLSLVKPFFLRPGKGSIQGGLSREAEPLLHMFADKVAEVVGSPKPDQIQLALDANASATFDTGLLGMGRKTFTLTIGIPLVAGMSLAQVAGIVAHEFGHFSQRGSTLLTRLIQRVNFWFAAAVYRHDTLDEAVDSMLESGEAIISVFGFLCWMLIGLGRGLLWCLMWIGILVSQGLSRKMEFDADRYEIGLVGSKAFKQSTRRLVELSVASAIAQEHAYSSLSAQGLPDDLPAFVAGLADSDKRVRKKAKRLIDNQKRSWLTTHPTSRSRIAAAERLDAPGVFHSELPASILFGDFTRHCRDLTRLLYRLRFGSEPNPGDLRPAYDALQIYLDTMGSRRGSKQSDTHE